MVLKMRYFLLVVALATVAMGQFNVLGPNSVEDVLFDNTERTRDMYILGPNHRKGAGPDGILTIYLSTSGNNFFANVEDAVAEGPGDVMGPKRVWTKMSDTCEPGKGFRYQTTDPYYPHHAFYDQCGHLMGFQSYVRGPTDRARTHISAINLGGIQHYDPDGTWQQDFLETGRGGPWLETLYQFTSDPTAAFPGHEAVRHHTLFVWFRNHTQACDVCIDDGSREFYTDRLAVGFKLQAGTTPHAPVIQSKLIDGCYHAPVKFFEYNADKTGDRTRQTTPFGHFDHARCVPFMGVHVEPEVVPPWLGILPTIPMYSPEHYTYTGFETDFHLLQEFGNRALEPEMYGKGGPAMDPSHNTFEPWDPVFNEAEYCAPGQWLPVPLGPGYPVAGVPGLSVPGTTSESQFSYYSVENICKNPNIISPHSALHFYFGEPLQTILTLCPTPLTFQTSNGGLDGGTDYTYRPIDGYREPFSPAKGPFANPFGILFDVYLRYTQSNQGAAVNPDNRHYYYHWLDGYEGHVDYCHNVGTALGFAPIKGGGERLWKQFGPWSFHGEPSEFCVMLQNLVESNPELAMVFNEFDVYNMKDLPALPRPRRISNALFNRPQKSSTKFLNMLQVYFGMFTVFDSMNFARDLQDHVYNFLEKCDPDKDPLCQCCSYEETLDLANLDRCFYNNARCVQVDFRAYKSPGPNPLVDWYVFHTTSDEHPRENGVLQTQMFDLSQIYDLTLYEANRFVRNGAKIHEQEKFLTNFNFFYGQFLLTLNERGGRVDDTAWTLRGDIRNNKNCAARAIADVFVRNHNRLVDECLRGHIGCIDIDFEDDWVVFNMARRYNIAQYQRVIFREYVPSILGIPLKEYDRNADGLAYTRNLQQYNKTFIPKITLEFSLAYRNSHGKIRDFLSRKNSFLDDIATIPVANHNNMSCLFDLNTGERRDGVMEQIIYGLVSDLSPDHGVFMANANRNQFLYQPSTGNDLASWNIIRGRDIGMPPINTIRAAYGLEAYNSCADLTADQEIVDLLHSLYGEANCIDRIDFFVAVMVEDVTQPQATVGSTAWAIFFDQYNRMRNGDRYYYENQLSADVASDLGFEFELLTSDSYNPIPFTDADIDDIFQTNFEALIALNTDVKVGELGNNLFFVKNRQLQTLALDGNLVAGDFENPPGFENKLSLSSTVTLWWRIDGNDITIRYQSLTPGWVGYGIGADPGTMRNGDIHFCSVDDNTGVGLITDRFALDVGPPQHDVDLGGTDDSFDQIANQVDGSTICQFTRKLDTGDQFDHPYKAGFTSTLFAFNPLTDEEVYHGPTRQNGIEIDYYFQFPIDDVSIIIIIALGVNGALGIIYCLFTLLIIVLKPDYFRFMSPLFCQLICVGSIIAFASVFPLMKDPPSEGSCMAYPWLLGLGFTLAFSCLFAKTWRLWRLFSRKSLKAKVIDNGFLLQIVAVFMFVICILLIVWTADTGFTVNREFTDEQQDEIHFLCDTETVYWGIFAGLFGASLLAGCVLTFLIRNLPQEYNDAEAIGMSIYNSTLMLVAGAAIGWGLEDNTNAVTAAKGFTVLITFWFLALVLFGPTHFRIFVSKKEPQTFKSTMAMGSGGSGVSGLTSGSTNS